MNCGSAFSNSAGSGGEGGHELRDPNPDNTISIPSSEKAIWKGEQQLRNGTEIMYEPCRGRGKLLQTCCQLETVEL